MHRKFHPTWGRTSLCSERALAGTGCPGFWEWTRSCAVSCGMSRLEQGGQITVVPSNLTLSVMSPSRTCLKHPFSAQRCVFPWHRSVSGLPVLGPLTGAAAKEMPTNPNSPSQLLRNRNLFAFTAQCSHWLGVRWVFPLYITDVHTNCKDPVPYSGCVSHRQHSKHHSLGKALTQQQTSVFADSATAKGQDISLPEMTFCQCQGTHSSSRLKHRIDKGRTLSVTNSYINPRLWSRKVWSTNSWSYNTLHCRVISTQQFLRVSEELNNLHASLQKKWSQGKNVCWHY